VKAGWNTKPLGELCDVIGGGTPPKDRPDYYGGDIPWATVRDMRTDIITSTEHSITKEAVKASATNIIPAGNVVIATRVGLGKVCLLGQDTAVNQDLRGIVPKSNKEIDVNFLFAWFKSISEQIIAEGTGATVQGVKLPFIKGLAVSFPEMEEQHRIVTLLDEAFADIATAKANAEKNLQNARELFSSFVQSLFMTKEDGWFHTTIGEQLQLQRGFDITKDQQTEGTVPVVSSGGIKSYHDTSMVDGPGVVIGRKGTLGKSFFLETSFWPHDTTLWVKDFKGNEPKLVYHLLSSLDLKKLDSGAANPALNRNQVHPLKIWWPDSTKQSDLVAIIDSMSGETTRLHEIYRQKLTALDDLKKSLLHQAFSGQL
jgi:type I restriction enzyme S subunit